jgi:hypothetical protein
MRTDLARRAGALGLTVALLAFPSADAATKEQLPAELSIEQLIGFARDSARAHEARPVGVPAHFDWARNARLGAGNNPGSFKAAIAWAHIFRSSSRGDLQSIVQVRHLQGLICHGPSRQWELVQRGSKLEGAQFRADFAQNATRSAPLFAQSEGVANIRFDAGAAFHYWTERGRFELPASMLCGWLVLMQARQEGPQGEDPSYLVGVGADYWLDKHAPWDNFRTNHDAAIGRLVLARPVWTWHGMTTASDADLRRLREQGFTVRSGLPPPAPR